MDLLEIRGRLDQIDTQIEKLFEERMRLCITPGCTAACNPNHYI